ncbi:MAG: putative Ig domain-containing protein, partial [Synergistaceae bacterium]|nr:putative Ig domain-containing protein [Synergistaceae bacterium]
MKKTARFVVFICGLLCVLLVSVAWGDVKINEGNFPDSVFRAYASQCDTGWEVMDSDGYRHIIGDNDGILAAEETNQIERFITNGVSSFKGLEFFPMLTSLYALHNNLTEFNGSANTRLISIDVDGNKITSLNVRSNGALQSLVCSNNNLTQLDVTANSRLRYLFCWRNPLGSLNISGNRNLEIVDCSNNGLTELNVQNNGQLRTLTCSNNKLISLNTSANPKLRELYCWDNPIGAIDVSNNTNLEILDCRETGISELKLTNHKALRILSCQNNALKELDLSGCTSLQNVYCENQRATGLTYKLTAEGYEINLKDLVSKPENIDVTSLTQNNSFLRYDGEKQTVLLNYRPQSFYYRYNTHSPKNDMMSVVVKFSMNTAVIERNGPIQNIIYGLNDKNYLDYSGNALTESSISGYSDRQYGMKGFAADGNSRLIVRVQTNRPGNVAFSFKNDIGATLEKLTDRTKLTASSTVTATKLNTEFYQASAVIVAPERFPEKGSFPEDKFTVHVKFTADETDEEIPDEEKIIEEDIELELHAAPVVLLHGFSGGANAESTFGINENIGVYRKLKDAKFNVSWWNYDGTKGPSVLLRNDYNGLFSTLVLAFEEYRKKGIVCTKADIVGYSMGGLVARYFCLPQQASYDGNYYTFRSYKQGMVRRIVDIAVPNKGSPWASYFCKDFSAINTNINFLAMSVSGWLMIAEPVIKRAVEQFMNGGRNSDSAWEDMAFNSVVTGGAYPVNVPMYSIYGQVKRDIDTFMAAYDLFTFLKTGGKYAEKYSGTNEYIDYLDKFKDDLDLSDKSLSLFSHAAPVHPLFTSILQAVQLVLSTSPAGIAKSLAEQLPTVINEAFFLNDEHDFCVSKNSAAGDLSGASLGRTGFFQYNHLAICKQNDIGNDVVSKLKGPKSAFKTFTKLSSSAKSSLPSSKSALPSDAGNDGEYNPDIAYAEKFKIELEPATLNVKGGNATLKVKATSSKKITNGADVYIVIQKDGLDRIFTAYGTDGKNFTKSIEFASTDAGFAKVYCFSYGEGEQLYISNTARLAIKATANNSDVEELYFAGDSGVRFAELGSDIVAGLYARTKDGTVFDVSSTAMGTVWDSSNYAVAYVDDDGVIHALIEGTSVLTAKYAGKTARISVNVGNNIWAPWMDSAELDGGKKGREYHAELIASGSAPIYWKLSGGMLPKGLELSSSGVISGVPEEEGEFSFNAEASNTAGSRSQSFKLKIGGSEVPDITTNTELPTVSRRQKYSVKLSAEGAGVSWLLKDGAIPDGLSFVESGEITGIPSKAGEYSFTIKAVNSAGEDTRTFTLKVTQTTVKGDIPATTARKATFTGTPKASGGASPYVWSVTAGKLPDGLKLNTSTGKITGSTSKAGTFNFTVKAKDKNGAAGTKAYTVKVTQTAVKGDIPTTTTRKATFTGTPKASGGASPYVWSVSAGKLPDGLKLNTSTGKITGSASKAGTFNFTVKAKDKNGAAGTKSYTVKVTQTTVKGDIPATTARKATFTGTPKASGGASPYV